MSKTTLLSGFLVLEQNNSTDHSHTLSGLRVCPPPQHTSFGDWVVADFLRPHSMAWCGQQRFSGVFLALRSYLMLTIL